MAEIENVERPYPRPLSGAKVEHLPSALVPARTALVGRYVTLEPPLIARRFYLGCLCPGCGQRGSVDLRRINRHPDASLESLIPMLSCQRCSPNPPFAKLTGVSRWPR
jgi:hypothetical protein